MSTWYSKAAIDGRNAGVFYVEDYGAVGDGVVIGDAAMTSGSGVLHSASSTFTATASVGMSVMVNGGQGTSAGPLISTIASVDSDTQITLNDPAGATVSGGSCVYGTDDTAAINDAVAAAGAYALTRDPDAKGSGNYFAQVKFAPCIYVLAGALTTAGNGSTTPTFRSQIPLPVPSSNTQRKLVIELVGAGAADNLQYWQSTVPAMQGTSLVSMIQPTGSDATFGRPSVIGGPSGSAGFTGSFAQLKPVMRNLTVWIPPLSNLIGYDFRWCGGFGWERSSAQAFTTVAGNAPKLPDLPGLSGFQASSSLGLAAPVVGNNDDCYADRIVVEGFETGVLGIDHFTCVNLACLYTDIGWMIDATQGVSGQSHSVAVQNFSCEATNVAIKTAGSSPGSHVSIYVNMTVEVINTFDVDDAGDILHGDIRWRNSSGGTPTKNGATNVTVTAD